VVELDRPRIRDSAGLANVSSSTPWYSKNATVLPAPNSKK